MICSVLMSCYNGEKYIAEQIDSILNQESIEIKLIIRDDGSSDSTIGILREYEDKNPETIKIILGENVGIHKSFYELLKKCPDTDFVAFADQDDYWDSDKLICAISQLQDSNSDFYSCAARLCDERLNELNRTTSDEKMNIHYQKKDNCVLTPGTQGCTIVVSNRLKKFLMNNSFPDYYGHDTWITVVSYYFFSCIYDKNTHMLYRQHNQSWTGNRKNRFMQFKREVVLFFSGLERYSCLANDLVARFGPNLDSSSYEVLLLLSKKKKNIKEKMNLILNHNFRKYGFIRNFVFKFGVLIGKV